MSEIPIAKIYEGEFPRKKFKKFVWRCGKCGATYDSLTKLKKHSMNTHKYTHTQAIVKAEMLEEEDFNPSRR